LPDGAAIEGEMGILLAVIAGALALAAMLIGAISIGRCPEGIGSSRPREQWQTAPSVVRVCALGRGRIGATAAIRSAAQFAETLLAARRPSRSHSIAGPAATMALAGRCGRSSCERSHQT